MDAQEYVNSVESDLSQLIQSGTKGSFLTNVLESQDIKSAYEKLLAQEESKLAELSSKIKEGKQKTVTINGESVPCKCQVANLTSFSSHMQRQDLIDYYSTGNFDKIAIVHSEFKDKIVFCEDLQKEINKKNKTNKVICVNKGTEILL